MWAGNQDIVVVGASAGGVEALQVLVTRFPADVKAGVFVVLHIGNDNQWPKFSSGHPH